MKGFVAISRRGAALFAAVLAVALVVVTVVVPLALGGGSALKESTVVGVGEHQSSFPLAQRDVSLVAAVDTEDAEEVVVSEEVEKLAEPTERLEIEYVDAAALEQAIAEKQQAAKEAEEKAKAAKKAEAERNAAIAAKKAQEAEAARQKAEAAKAQAAKAKESAAITGTDWQPVVASVYYDVGGPLANGGILKASDVIIAHKTLPLGTKVELEYNGRKVVATVEDRGPYIDGRDIDLAPGVQDKLGLYDGVHTVKMRLLG